MKKTHNKRKHLNATLEAKGIRKLEAKSLKEIKGGTIITEDIIGF